VTGSLGSTRHAPVDPARWDDPYATLMDEFLPESETGCDGVVPGQLDTIVADRTIIETGQAMLMAAYGQHSRFHSPH
jgi:hypothetical protein